MLIETRDISDEAEPLESFKHPDRATYLLMGRDIQFPIELREKAASCIKVTNDPRMTPGVAGVIFLYDRHLKTTLSL